jgi:hypothetical protein
VDSVEVWNLVAIHVEVGNVYPGLAVVGVEESFAEA